MVDPNSPAAAPSCFAPDWQRPARVRAILTTRRGGVSRPPFDSFNLGAFCGDDPGAVAANRAALRRMLPAEPRWLRQMHGTRTVRAEEVSGTVEADASCTSVPDVVCAVLAADCLPVLLCDAAATTVAAVHAGWRGMAGGVIESAVSRFDAPPQSLHAYLGPAISPAAYEVGEEVRQAFVAGHPADAAAFQAGQPGKYACDLYRLARFRLERLGVRHIEGGSYCTAADSVRFYSYRREGRTGRCAALIWLESRAP